MYIRNKNIELNHNYLNNDLDNNDLDNNDLDNNDLVNNDLVNNYEYKLLGNINNTNVLFPFANIINFNSLISKGNSSHNGSKNILIAEDDQVNFILLKRFLKPINADILHAINGKMAVDLFEGNSINLILMDIRMPVMTGYEATKIIREKDKTIPIIAQTAYVGYENLEEAYKSGCNEVLEKPIEKDKLIETVNKYL